MKIIIVRAIYPDDDYSFAIAEAGLASISEEEDEEEEEEEEEEGERKERKEKKENVGVSLRSYLCLSPLS